MLVSNKALSGSMPYRHRQMVDAARVRQMTQPSITAVTKREPYNAHVVALLDQEFGYARPWWEVYGDEPTPSVPEINSQMRYSDSPAAVRFRSHYPVAAL